MSGENKGFSFVKCCERNKNYIYLTYDDNLFNIDDESGVLSSNIEYCPWCGILLDTNLLED